ncbi:MAG TPA: outer membrane beta-barrel protein [Gammaproteobacteria bacterium]
MQLTIKILLIGFGIWVTPVFAGSIYTGLAGAQTIIDTGAGEVKPVIGVFKLGYELTGNVALELQYGAGGGDDELDSQKYEVDSFGAAFLRFSSGGGISGVRLYLLAGYAQSELKIDDVAPTDDDKYNGFAWGIGAEEFLKSANNLAVVAEYMRYYDRDELGIDAITLGLRYRF